MTGGKVNVFIAKDIIKYIIVIYNSFVEYEYRQVCSLHIPRFTIKYKLTTFKYHVMKSIHQAINYYSTSRIRNLTLTLTLTLTDDFSLIRVLLD